MTWDPHREDEARWVEAMRQRHARGQEYVCGLADVLRTIEERDEARAEIERLRRDLARCREAQRATAEGWRHEVAEVASIIGAPAHTAELAACVRAEVERLGRERDEARAQVERLRALLYGFTG